MQNLLALRFANGMFEPVWNRNHIDHIQIDVPETLSIEMRGSFYEQTGAFRDMIVTHLFQVLSFVAMEPPISLEREAADGERQKVFDSMPPLAPGDVVRGQYAGYRAEDGVAADSETETFVALRPSSTTGAGRACRSSCARASGMAESRHLLTVAFKQPPRRMFPLDCDQVAESFGHDHLTFELGDPGSISASFLAKVPGPRCASARRTCGSATPTPSAARAGARGLRAADPRRHGRRPHPVHQLRRRSSASGRSPSRCWISRRRCSPMSPAPGARRRSTS